MVIRLAANPVWLSVLGCWAWRALAALLIGAPLIAFVSAQTSGLPKGDAVLFEPGGVYLLELWRVHRAALEQLALAGSAALLAVVLVGELPLALIVIALARDRGLSRAYEECFGLLPRLWACSLLAWLCRCLITLGAALAGLGVFLAFAPVADERVTDGSVLVCTLLAASPLLAVSALHDLWRTAYIGRSQRASRALAEAWSALRRRALTMAVAFLGRQLAALAIVCGAGYLVGELDVGGGGSARLLAAGTLHQLVLLAVAWLRVSWLRQAHALLQS